MDKKYEWNLEDLFKNEKELEENRKKIYEYLREIEQYQGKLINSSENIAKCYQTYEKMLEIFDKVYSYGMFRYHQNMAKPENIALFKKSEQTNADIAKRTSFIVPEITKIEEETLKQYLVENKNLQRYHRIIEDIIEDKKHILSEEVENVLASYSEVFNGCENTYDIFTNTEFVYPKIKDENGNEVELTDATYSKYLASKNQDVRIGAFNSMYSLYKKHINTITELYLTRVKEDTISSQLRKYKSSLEKAVENDDATSKVYESLVEVVNENLKINHRYMKLKKKLLGLEEMHIYDIYVNTYKDESENISVEQAEETVLKALEPLGTEYQEKLKHAFSSRWIDVFEKPNKRSGAYSSGVHGVHPFVLTNFTGRSRDVSTIAHELGHAMHSYYSSSSQNIMDASYTIMVAEVASTVNEIILGQYLIEKEQDKIKKAALINEQLDDIRATLIRQTMFAEFEKIIHERVENLETLTSEELCDIYFKLNQKYFGKDVVIDDNIKYEWARIPHFYSCFYVYKYATGISAAIAIATKILNKEEGIVEKYINMLKQGRMKKSVDLLKMVGVDLESKKPYEDAFAFYHKQLEELEKLV